MAIKTISQFPSGIPADNDYILFEQNGEGKHTTISDAVNTCALSYEEIMATNPASDLSGKVASAGALKNIGNKVIGKVDYVGNLQTIDNIKAWVVQNKPSNPWVAWASNNMCATVFGTPFNTYLGGYVGIMTFNYFSSSVDFYTLNNGSWNK